MKRTWLEASCSSGVLIWSVLIVCAQAWFSESRGFALHAVTSSRRSCLTAVWSSPEEWPDGRGKQLCWDGFRHRVGKVWVLQELRMNAVHHFEICAVMGVSLFEWKAFTRMGIVCIYFNIWFGIIIMQKLSGDFAFCITKTKTFFLSFLFVFPWKTNKQSAKSSLRWK